MKRVKFELQVYCTIGWDDVEDIASLEVDTFAEVLEAAYVLKNWERNRHLGKNDEGIIQSYREIKESLKTESGEEVAMVGEVIGIQCSYEDDKGVRASMTLSDNSGVSGWAKVDNEEYGRKCEKQLAEAKRLATNIMRL